MHNDERHPCAVSDRERAHFSDWLFVRTLARTTPMKKGKFKVTDKFVAQAHNAGCKAAERYCGFPMKGWPDIGESKKRAWRAIVKWILEHQDEVRTK